MKPKHLLLVALILVLICFAVMTVMGRTCVYTLRTINMAGEASDYTVTFDPEPAPLELTDQSMEGGRLASLRIWRTRCAKKPGACARSGCCSCCSASSRRC